ncbi:MAG: HupE/UreJ family protein [Bryobacteraceae bacterium]
MKLVAILTLLCAGLAQTHEIGTSRVTVELKNNRTYDIEVVTDATALAEKLDAVAGREPSSNLDASHLQKLLNQSDTEFRQRVNVRFDGAEVRPDVTYSVTPAAGRASVPPATIHLTGQIPEGARQLSWRYAWTFATYALTVKNGEAAVTEWLEGGQTSRPISVSAPPAGPEGRLAAIARYLKLGFTHIVPEGLDHMLFVLGIYLLSRRARDVLWQVSAFTVAHSITLGLSMYGLVSISPGIVEPVIAISIAYVAVENIFLSELKAWRVALVFAFGLLHGLGFAGALKDLALPPSEFLTALVTFNVGVEAGQLAVIAAAFLLFGWQFSHQLWYRRRIVVPVSSMIACLAVYWMVDRLVS